MDFEDRVGAIGRELIAQARQRRHEFWTRERWEELLFQRVMEHDRFRTQLLRFVDVLPALATDAEIAAHVEEYFSGGQLPLPEILAWSASHTHGAVGQHVAGAAVRLALHALARRFVGGATADDARGCLVALRKRRLLASVDVLGETTLSDHEADACRDRYLAILGALGAVHSPGETVQLSVKLSALCPHADPVAADDVADAVKSRLRPILQLAREQGASVCLDMEHVDLKAVTLRVFRDLAGEPAFHDWPGLGIAVQAYLRDAEEDLQELVAWAARRAAPVTVRLVRGAYWDQEAALARRQGWPVPVWLRKEETDVSYERCCALLLENHPRVTPAFATHNVRSLAAALALADARGLDKYQYEIQMLYGMADPLKDALVAMHRRVRVYVPVGALLPGMAYLVRRLLENTSSQSFLRMAFGEDQPVEHLLAPPVLPEEPAAAPAASLVPEPVLRFAVDAERERLRRALAYVRGRLGRAYPLVIGDERKERSTVLRVYNPARPEENIGRVAAANASDINYAVAAATRALGDWRARGMRARADILSRAADLLRARRDEFAAWEILEAGKPWREADADVCEAIDYLAYYAREALRLDEPRRFDVPGERNDYGYRPRGVVAVIPPWNFPLAIPCGMTAAAIVTGNTVLLKPAPETPVVAAHLVDLLLEAGVPPGVVNFVPGEDDAIGDHLVSHPGVHMIAFTGSAVVGRRILRLAAAAAENQPHLKRVLAEMGGKNAIVVDDDADLDEAVAGIVASAFGYAGQKCSAASRVIVVDRVHDALVARLVAAVRSIRMGSPELPGVMMGPVISAASRMRIEQAVKTARRTAKLACDVEAAGLGAGHYVGPKVLVDVDPKSPLAQEEIFGPVLAVLRAWNFEDALAIANATPYALTGGVYSRRPSHLERARREFEAGNLYLNRPITGARVGRQPFGGFKLSGTGGKAGGPDYLLQFVEPQSIAENTSRHGFIPPDEQAE